MLKIIQQQKSLLITLTPVEKNPVDKITPLLNQQVAWQNEFLIRHYDNVGTRVDGLRNIKNTLTTRCRVNIYRALVHCCRRNGIVEPVG